MRDFWLVQRIRRAPYAHHREAFPQAKVKSNPFGYGRLGDYELDYMGAAEFEWGAIPEANNRLAKAGKDLRIDTHQFNGHVLDFLWIGKEGEPFERWDAWTEAGCDGKEPPYSLRILLGLTEPFGSQTVDDYRDDTQVWWGLEENVQWAFHDGEDGHLFQMLKSMATEPVEFLR